MSINSISDAGWTERLEFLPQGGLDLGRVLVGDQTETEFHSRSRGQHRLGTFPLVAAPHAVDVERRPRPAAFQRGVAGFAGHAR